MGAQRSRIPIDPSDSENTGLARSDRQRPGDLDIEEMWLHRAQLDNEAFAFFYKKYRPKVHGYVLARVADRDLADDLVGETFYRALVKLSSFTWQGHALGSWLFRISRPVVSQEVCRRKAKPEVLFDPTAQDLTDARRSDLEVDAHDERRILRMCFARLTSERRQVMTKYYGLGSTTKEAGVEMGIAESTVKSHLQRGRNQLRGLLVARGVERGVPGG